MRKCESDKCKRDMILEYFGLSSFPRNSDNLHDCCDYREKFCTCEDCLLSSMQLVMNPSSHKEFPQASDEEMPTRFKLNKKANFMKNLLSSGFHNLVMVEHR